MIVMSEIGIVRWLHNPAINSCENNDAADKREPKAENNSVGNDWKSEGQHERPVGRRWKVNSLAVGALLCNLCSRGDAHELAVLGFAVLAIPEVVDAGNGGDWIEVVGRRRRRGHPFDRAAIPRVGADRRKSLRLRLAIEDVEDKQGDTGGKRERTNGGDLVPEFEPVACVVGVDTTAHTLKSEHVHRSKSEVEAKKHQPEVGFTDALIEHVAKRLRPIEVEPGHEPEESSTKEDVVEVSDDEVGIGLLCVHRGN